MMQSGLSRILAIGAENLLLGISGKRAISPMLLLPIIGTIIRLTILQKILFHLVALAMVRAVALLKMEKYLLSVKTEQDSAL
ncbi:MAG: hypothetical protein A2V79_09145 [Betaproteobacteria bacterium RBG_16_56_24]|nr:MAG: hypothetical protein A2V79_09145 [Betaproteobacteria bacterium RBG_16_56_24]